MSKINNLQSLHGLPRNAQSRWGGQTLIRMSYKYVSQSVLSARKENMELNKDIKEETGLVRGKVREL